MGLVITHNFVSPVLDEANPGEVGPDEWNDVHVVSGVPAGSVETPAGPTVNIDPDEDDHVLLPAGAVTVNLPPSADREAGRGLLVVDYANDADTNTKTIVPDGAETILGLSSVTITFRGGVIELWPRPDDLGWYARGL